MSPDERKRRCRKFRGTRWQKPLASADELVDEIAILQDVGPEWEEPVEILAAEQHVPDRIVGDGRRVEPERGARADALAEMGNAVGVSRVEPCPFGLDRAQGRAVDRTRHFVREGGGAA